MRPNEPFPMTERKRKVIIAIIIIGFLLAFAVALTDTQPAGATAADGACWKWWRTCAAYRTILGVKICYAWKFTCISAPALGTR
jgi:hypothetical protein